MARKKVPKEPLAMECPRGALAIFTYRHTSECVFRFTCMGENCQWHGSVVVVVEEEVWGAAIFATFLFPLNGTRWFVREVVEDVGKSGFGSG